MSRMRVVEMANKPRPLPRSQATCQMLTAGQQACPLPRARRRPPTWHRKSTAGLCSLSAAVRVSREKEVPAGVCRQGGQQGAAASTETQRPPPEWFPPGSAKLHKARGSLTGSLQHPACSCLDTRQSLVEEGRGGALPPCSHPPHVGAAALHLPTHPPTHPPTHSTHLQVDHVCAKALRHVAHAGAPDAVVAHHNRLPRLNQVGNGHLHACVAGAAGRQAGAGRRRAEARSGQALHQLLQETAPRAAIASGHPPAPPPSTWSTCVPL